MTDSNLQYHIGLSSSLIENARYVLMPGDPARVAVLSAAFPRSRPLGQNREYRAALAYDEDLPTPILIMSTGIGAPSAAIAIEELACLGVRYFLRVGTTGAIQEHIGLGDLVISEASVRLEGTSSHYAPIEYPAAASIDMTYSLLEAARALGVPHHSGMTCSSDSFWPGQERHDSFGTYVPRRFQGTLEEWRRLNVLSYEMENSALFVVCRALGLEAASVCAVVACRWQREAVCHDAYTKAKHDLARVAMEAVRHHATRIKDPINRHG
ncbi:nucleoside phosphorylase [Acidiferrobacter sp.]